MFDKSQTTNYRSKHTRHLGGGNIIIACLFMTNSAFKILFISFSLMVACNEASARPTYANEVGRQCAFCHVGTMGSRNFTTDGLEYCKYLKNNGRLPVSGACTNRRLELFDAAGNSVGTHTICVPDQPPC